MAAADPVQSVALVADAAAASALVKRLVSEHAVLVFSKTYCPFCAKAKEALRSVGAKFAVLELDTRDDGDRIQAALAELTGRRTVPNVFVGGRTIGGGDDTARLAQSGELAKLATAAGAIGGKGKGAL
jgi:glutaredoxin 3